MKIRNTYYQQFIFYFYNYLKGAVSCISDECRLYHLTDTFRRICSRRLLKTLWQKEKIAHDEQFPILPQCFQLYLMIKLSFMEISHTFANMFSKSSAAKVSYVGKGLRDK